MAYRIEKVESLLKQEISSILLYGMRDPIFGFITVTKVKASPDLKIAKVYISVLEKEKRQETLDKITAAAGYIRSQLGSRVKLRYVPEVKFFLDDTLDYVEKIDKLIKKIHENDQQIEP